MEGEEEAPNRATKRRANSREEKGGRAAPKRKAEQPRADRRIFYEDPDPGEHAEYSATARSSGDGQPRKEDNKDTKKVSNKHKLVERFCDESESIVYLTLEEAELHDRMGWSHRKEDREQEEDDSVSDTVETEWIVDHPHEAKKASLKENKWYRQMDKWGNHTWMLGQGGWKSVGEKWRRVWSHVEETQGDEQNNVKKKYRKVIQKKWFGWIDYDKDHTEERRHTEDQMLNPGCPICRSRARSGEAQAVQDLIAALDTMDF